MASFIVEGVGPNGVRTWVVIEATNTGDARTKANQILEEGFTPNISVTADAGGVATLNSQSPGFSAKFPSDYTADSIVSELGGAVQRSFAPPPVKPVGPDGLPENTFGPNAGLVAPDDPTYQFQQYLSGLGRRGAGTSGVAGRARLSRFAPNQARFLADQALNPLSSGQAGTFADFTAREALSGQGANQNASDLFDQAVRMGRGINPTGAGFGNLSEMQQGFLNPSDRTSAEQFENLARAKARSQFGVASEFFKPNVDLREQFFAQDAPSAMSFGDFLNNKIFGQAAPGQQMNLGKIGTPAPGFSDDTRSQFDTYASGLGR
tara:strand:- start:223 stop:1185 length:963 start_codon:yes stop_codon:yes gene_type:complete